MAGASQVTAGRARQEIHAGFVPLTDCAPLVVAKELGFDEQEGFSLILHREVSWANIRDKVNADYLDCAIMLAPMPLASTLGLGGRHAVPLAAVMATSLNGNAITLSKDLFGQMCEADPANAKAGGMKAAIALARIVEQRRAEGMAPLTLGIVYPFSSHNYDLRYWLAAAGIDPDHDMNLVVVPPPLIAGELKARRIDGFCVGMPWNSLAVDDGDGVIVATKAQLWSASPEKVLGLKRTFADNNRDVTAALIRATYRACAWLDEPANRRAAATMLSAPEYVGISAEILARALNDELQRGADFTEPLPAETIIFHRHHANFPWVSHATWLLTQMIRWGQVSAPFDIRGVAASVYRPDLYRSALAEGSGVVPQTDMKNEGDGSFFGTDSFDPARPVDYLARFQLRAGNVDLAAFERECR